MTRLAEIQARIGGMHELLNVVGAMRSLAGMRMQEAQHSLPGIRRHAAAIATAIADTLPLLPESERRPGAASARRALVVYMAEYGFVGGFNERLIEELQRGHRPDDMLFVLGTRGAVLLLEHGLDPAWSHAMATRSRAAAEVIQTLSTELYRQIARGKVTRVEAVYFRADQAAAGDTGSKTGKDTGSAGVGAAIMRRPILPFDTTRMDGVGLQPTVLRQVPLHNLAPAVLHERLAAEYIFAQLTEAAVESIAGENAARFSAMESAHDNVSHKLAGLRQEARVARQSEITNEILELVTAEAALTGGTA